MAGTFIYLRDKDLKLAQDLHIDPKDMVRMIINAGLPVIQGNEPATLQKTNELLEKMLRIMSGKDEEYAEARKEGF